MTDIILSDFEGNNRSSLSERTQAFLTEQRKPVMAYRQKLETEGIDTTNLSDLDILYKQHEECVSKNQLSPLVEEMMMVDKSEGPWQKYAHEVIQNLFNAPENKKIFETNEKKTDENGVESVSNLYGDLSKCKIYLSVDEKPNACIVNQTKPPILIISKGIFFDKAGNPRPIDCLAYVLGHELGHPFMKNWSRVDTQSQFQEVGSDAIGAVLALNAGYNPKSMYDFWRESEDPVENPLSRFFTIHPIGKDRLNLLSDIIGHVGHKKEIQTTEQQYNPHDLEVIKQRYGKTFWEKFIKSIEYDANKALSESEKRKALLLIFDYMVNERLDLWAEYHSYLLDEVNKLSETEQRLFVNAVYELPVSLQNKELKKQAVDILNELPFVHPEYEAEVKRRNYLMHDVYTNDDYHLNVLTQIKAFHDKYGQSHSALDSDESVDKQCPLMVLTEYAYKGVHNLPKLEPLSNRFSDNYGANRAGGVNLMPHNFPYSLAWDRDLELLDRLTKEEEKEVVREILNLSGFQKALSKAKEYFNIENDRIILSSKTKNYNRSWFGETEYFNYYHKRMEEEVAKMDWSLMESDFNQFISLYQDSLIPEHAFSHTTGLASESAVIQKFTDKLNELYAQNPQKYTPIIQNFYSHILPRFVQKSYEDFNSLEMTDDRFLSAQNPYIRFFETPAGQVIPNEEKLKFVLGHVFVVESLSTRNVLKFDIFTLCGYKQPQTIAELNAFFNVFSKEYHKFSKEYRIQADLFKQYVYGKCIEKVAHDIGEGKYQDGLIELPILTYPQRFRCKDFDTDKIGKFLSKIAKHNIRILLKKANNELIRMPYTSDYVPLEDNRQDLPNGLKKFAIFSAEYIKYNTQRKENCLYTYRIGEMIPVENEQFGLRLQKIIQDTFYKDGTLCFDMLKDERLFSFFQKHIEELLATEPNGIGELKEVLIDTLSSLYAFKIGIDNDKNPEAFFNQMPIERCMDLFSYPVAKEVICRIMKKTQTQKNVSAKVKEVLNNHPKRDYHREFWATTEGLRSLHQCGLNQTVLDFLISPVSMSSVRDLINAINRKAINYQDRNSILGGVFSLNENMRENNVKTARLIAFHREFWRQEQSLQLGLIKHLIFESGVTADNIEAVQELQSSFEKVKNKLLKGVRFKKEAVAILDTYFKQCKYPETQALFVAGLYTVEPPKNIPLYEAERIMETKTIQRPGKLIFKILSSMGAAGGKVLQALHSFPGLPNEIRQDLKEVKSNYNPPERYEIFEDISRMKDRDGMPLSNKILHVGKLLGAGSFGYTVQVVLNDKKRTTCALTLLRHNVEAEANIQFKRYLLPAAESLAKLDKAKFGELPETIKKAIDLTAVEADFHIGAKQIEIARKQYGQFSLMIGNHHFNVKSAELMDYGKEFKMTELASGKHFNDLPAKTPEEKAFKQAVAKAIFCVELSILLQGKEIDSDRHGAQVRIDGENITMFDHGAMEFILPQREKQNDNAPDSPKPFIPTDENKECLIQIVSDILKEKKKGCSIKDLLIQRMDSQCIEPQNRLFISTVKRALLAMNDYVEAMGNTPREREKNLEECFVAIGKQAHKLGIMDTILATHPEVIQHLLTVSSVENKQTLISEKAKSGLRCEINKFRIKGFAPLRSLSLLGEMIKGKLRISQKSMLSYSSEITQGR